MDPMSSASPPIAAGPAPAARALPPVLGRLLSGSFWLALRVPLQLLFSLWTVRLIVQAIGRDSWGAYQFAWGFGFFQMLFEFGFSSGLQQQISERWTRGDRDGVDGAIACGMNFYGAMALVQAAALLGVTYGALPHSEFVAGSPEYGLIVKLLWLQILTSPCYGFSVVVSSVLQAARRYDFMPRLELMVVILRFVVLAVGLKAGVDFFLVIVAQIVVQVLLTMGPSLWVMVTELGHVPHFRGARWADYKSLGHISFYMALIQISVALADKVDTTILGFMLPDPGAANAVYGMVSKPFLQLRQTGWTLAYMVMPAVASLASARDERGLERIKYDGTRLHIASLLPVGLLGWIYAAPFLTLWMGNSLGYDAALEAPLMRLFLLAAMPLVLSVPVQMAIGINRIEVIALSALIGSLINLPVSCALTARLGMPGVIWGTLLTTFFSNLLVPGIYIFRVLEIRPGLFFRRTLGAPLAGGAAAIAATSILRLVFPATSLGTSLSARVGPLVVHLLVGLLAYLAGYLSISTGRRDFAELSNKLRRR
jgi:O-antigen/teichoic acid export membrane protein